MNPGEKLIFFGFGIAAGAILVFVLQSI